MRDNVLLTAAAGLLSLSLAACQMGASSGAAGGAVAGAVVGGPVGAVVGGVTGAALGAALSPEETTRVQQYVVTQRAPSVRLREEVSVGDRLPQRVTVRPLPRVLGVSRPYGYTVINNRPVLVEPSTREIVYIYE